MRQGGHQRKSRRGRALSEKFLLRAEALDLRLPPLSGLDVRIVERPGNWVPASKSTCCSLTCEKLSRVAIRAPRSTTG